MIGLGPVVRVKIVTGVEGAGDVVEGSGRRNSQVTLAHCWSHLRRKVLDLAKGGSAPIATEALLRIGELYAIEADIRGQEAPVRAGARQSRSGPLIVDLNSWLETQLTKGRTAFLLCLELGSNTRRRAGAAVKNTSHRASSS